jgi:hypothetical protein
MSTTHYFEKFPVITYNKYQALDIVSNAKLVERFINNPYVYYPYQLSEYQRADVIASQYYDDPYYTWLIYYGNKVVDPYYDWHLADDDFNNFLIGKYGSVENAQKRVIFYRTNWYSDDRQISSSIFENTISSAEKKYWEKKFNEEIGVLLYYYRKPLDIQMNTNKIIVLETSNTGSFVVGDLVDVRRSSQDIGTAEVLGSNTTTVTIKNIYLTQGNIVAGDILRHDSNTSITATVTSTLRTTVNIPDAEMAYWEPVTYYDYENEQNTMKKNIKLVDNQLTLLVSEALSDAMST